MKRKPLAEISGRPMVEHVYGRAKLAKGVERVIVATDHEEIAAAVKSFGGEVMMTGDCETGSDRVAQVAHKLKNFDIVVNVQGDWLLPPETIEESITPLIEDSTLGIASLKRLFRENEDPADPRMVKVVTDLDDNALYFSRALLPFRRDAGGRGPFLHIGIYAFRREVLLEFAELPRTPLERTESLEQLRALEHGIRIRVPTTAHFSVGVDTPEDLVRVRNMFD